MHLPLHADIIRPVVAPYVPTGQFVQADAEANENFPTEQLPEQTDVIDPVVEEYRPAAQLVQATAAGSEEY